MKELLVRIQMQYHQLANSKKVREVRKFNKLNQIDQCVDSMGKKFFQKTFMTDSIASYGITPSFQVSVGVHSSPASLLFPEHFLLITQQMETQKITTICTIPYEQNLYDYILKSPKQITEKEALIIFDQVLKAIYSLYKDSFCHANVRPEHFVKVGSTWKLESIIWDCNYENGKDLKSEYLWDPNYQPPECYDKIITTDEEYDRCLVWCLGSLFLDIMLTTHSLRNKSILDKFKGKPFSLEAIGFKSNRISLSKDMQQILGNMLHHDPQKRMKIDSVFRYQLLSQEVAKHAKKNNVKAQSISIQRVSILQKVLPKEWNNIEFKQIYNQLEEKNRVGQKMLQVSDEEFNINLNEVSSFQYAAKVGAQLGNGKQNRGELRQREAPLWESVAHEQAEQEVNMPDLMNNEDKLMQEAMKTYKCYYDQTELLLSAINKFSTIPIFTAEAPQLIALSKYSVSLIALMNLHALTEALNRNFNLLELESDVFTVFQSSVEAIGFRKILNYQREKKIKIMESALADAKAIKGDLKKKPHIQILLRADYKNVNYSDIKAGHRYLLQKLFNRAAIAYNENKESPLGKDMAQMAIYVTYCLAVDKLYIPKNIPENFELFFEWKKEPVSNYVPLYEFQRYICNAPSKTLVQHSNFIYKRYFQVSKGT